MSYMLVVLVVTSSMCPIHQKEKLYQDMTFDQCVAKEQSILDSIPEACEPTVNCLAQKNQGYVYVSGAS